jgi:hypothetical protein
MQFDRLVIVSAELSDLSSLANDRRTSNLRDCLGELGLGFSRSLGVYKGKIEQSFVVRVTSDSEHELLKDMALKSFEQECILYRDSHGKAYLQYENTEVLLGELRNVKKENAHLLTNGYTVLNGLYYAAA